MKYFADTALFIYLIENHPQYAGKVKKVFADATVNGDILVTSVISYMEFGVKPLKDNHPELLQKLDELLQRLHIELLEVDKESARWASHLRAKYDFLKGLDALQLGLALSQKCTVFLSNDKQLRKVSEITVSTLDDIA